MNNICIYDSLLNCYFLGYKSDCQQDVWIDEWMDALNTLSSMFSLSLSNRPSLFFPQKWVSNPYKTHWSFPSHGNSTSLSVTWVTSYYNAGNSELLHKRKYVRLDCPSVTIHTVQIQRSRFYPCQGLALNVPPHHMWWLMGSKILKPEKKSVLLGLALKKTMFVFTTVLWYVCDTGIGHVACLGEKWELHIEF